MRMRKSARATLTSAISREFRNPLFHDEIRAKSATVCIHSTYLYSTKEASFSEQTTRSFHRISTDNDVIE